MKFIKKYKGLIVAWVVIMGSVATIAAVVLTDTKSDPVPVTRPLAIASSSQVAKASSTSPVKPPRVDNTTVPSDYTKLHGDTITYIVSGSSAHISYGHDASESAVTPFNKTEAIKDSNFFSIVVRMDDGGSKTKVVVKINGKTVAKTFATPEHPLASVAISKEYGSKGWMAVPSTSS